MMIVALCALAAPALTAADFFPCQPGTHYLYDEKAIGPNSTEDIVQKTWIISGRPAIQVDTNRAGRLVNITYYRVDSDSLSIVAYGPSKDGKAPDALPQPTVLFKLPTGSESITWTFSTPYVKGVDPVSGTGTAKFGGIKEYLHKKVETLDVKLVAVVGTVGPPEYITQDYTYAKGIGLVEVHSTNRVGKKGHESFLKLASVAQEGKVAN